LPQAAPQSLLAAISALLHLGTAGDLLSRKQIILPEEFFPEQRARPLMPHEPGCLHP
jgi:hypothetical protein